MSNGSEIDQAKERWHILVNTVAAAWNNGLVPGNDEECVEWASREILNHGNSPRVRSDELIALSEMTAERDDLRDENARLLRQLGRVK